MTAVLPERPDLLDAGGQPLAAELPPEPEHRGPGGGTPDDEDVIVRSTLVCLSAALSTLAAAWLVTRLFRGGLVPEIAAVLSVGLGAGLIALSYRLPRPAPLQHAVIPAVAALGALLATTGAGEGGSLPSLVLDALRTGGLREPPVPFDPGWRFLVVALLGLVSSASAATACALARPNLAVALPLPLTLGAALLQPKGSEVLAGGVAVALAVAALAVAYGAELAGKGITGGGFEMRRLLRGAVLLVGVLAALAVLARTDVLFPATEQNRVIPPQKPPTPPPSPDRVLFTVSSPRNGPWRVGVLDVYDRNAFLLPPVDPARVRELPREGTIATSGAKTYSATFTAADVKGQTLPAPANPVRLRSSADARFDPRTQILRLVETSVPRDFTYTVTAVEPPEGKALANAPDPAPDLAREFTAMPPAPAGVLELLRKAPTDNLFDRLQFVRNALYTRVVAAGAGRPVDVLPERVDAMLAGGNATPYEINAAEVMLARWAGVPARLGFGFHGGDKRGDGTFEFRPRHGAAWLEAYFEGHGWIPILGTPPKAQPSLSDEQKKKDPAIQPSPDLALTVFVPVRIQGLRMLYELVRYYVVRVLPPLLLLALLVFAYPAALKFVRTRRRRRWAAARGPAATIAVAYAELRDRAHDLTIGHVTDTPLEFLARIEDDDEHAELAWLVTRALWGDLARDLRPEDAAAATDMAASVTRRLLREQTPLNRVLARTARTSLREPFSDEVPNVWRRRRVRARARLRVPVLARLRRARLATAVLALFAVVSCGGETVTLAAPATYPAPMPQAVAGYRVVREEKAESRYRRDRDAALVSEGRVYTIRTDYSVEGSVQIALFKPDVDNQDRKVQAGIEKAFGPASAFRTRRIGMLRLRQIERTDQSVFLWFPPERNVMELFVMRKEFRDAERVVLAFIAAQRGLTLEDVT